MFLKLEVVGSDDKFIEVVVFEEVKFVKLSKFVFEVEEIKEKLKVSDSIDNRN